METAMAAAAPATTTETPAAPVSAASALSSTTPAPVAPAAPAPTPAPDWVSGLADAQKLFVNTKGFKDPAAVVDSYVNLEKLLGAPKERLVKLPEKENDPEAWKEVHLKLGMPAKKEDYGITPPKDGDPAFSNWATDTFHGLGLSKKQAHALVDKFGEFQKGVQTSQVQVAQQKAAQEDQALHREWGSAYEQNIKQAQMGAKKFGVTPDVIDKLEASMGFSGVMKFLQTIGAGLGEDGFELGAGQANFKGVLTPSQARERIKQLKSDKDWSQKYLTNQIEAKQEMDRLMRMANPESA